MISVSAVNYCDANSPCYGEYCSSSYDCVCNYDGGNYYYASCNYQGGAIAGIVIACVIGVCLICCLLAWWGQRRRRYMQGAYINNSAQQPTTMTAVYATSPVYAQAVPMQAIPVSYAQGYPHPQQQLQSPSQQQQYTYQPQTQSAPPPSYAPNDIPPVTKPQPYEYE